MRYTASFLLPIPLVRIESEKNAFFAEAILSEVHDASRRGNKASTSNKSDP